jgi:hypothetical protein
VYRPADGKYAVQEYQQWVAANKFVYGWVIVSDDFSSYKEANRYLFEHIGQRWVPVAAEVD